MMKSTSGFLLLLLLLFCVSSTRIDRNTNLPPLLQALDWLEDAVKLPSLEAVSIRAVKHKNEVEVLCVGRLLPDLDNIPLCEDAPRCEALMNGTEKFRLRRAKLADLKKQSRLEKKECLQRAYDAAMGEIDRVVEQEAATKDRIWEVKETKAALMDRLNATKAELERVTAEEDVVDDNMEEILEERNEFLSNATNAQSFNTTSGKSKKLEKEVNQLARALAASLSRRQRQNETSGSDVNETSIFSKNIPKKLMQDPFARIYPPGGMTKKQLSKNTRVARGGAMPPLKSGQTVASISEKGLAFLLPGEVASQVSRDESVEADVKMPSNRPFDLNGAPIEFTLSNGDKKFRVKQLKTGIIEQEAL